MSEKTPDDFDELLNLKISFKVKPYRFNPSEDIAFRIVSTLYLLDKFFRSKKTSALGICLIDAIIENNLDLDDLKRALTDSEYKISSASVFSVKAFRVLGYMIGYGLIEATSVDTYSLTDKGIVYLKHVRDNEPDILNVYAQITLDTKLTISSLKKILEK